MPEIDVRPGGEAGDEPAGAPAMSPEAAPAPERDLEAELAARAGYMGELEEEVAQLRNTLESEVAARTELQRELEQAVAKYREAALAAAPELPGDLVTGATVREVEEAVARARRLVEQVRSQMEARAQQTRVPAGAPPRSAPDLSALSPQEKIALGLQRGR